MPIVQQAACQCARCGHVWLPEQPTTPRRCAKCKTPYWDKPINLKARAAGLVNRAIAKGTLVRPAQCEQCKLKCRVEAHHDDYAKPLDVKWLCGKCHIARHKQLGWGFPNWKL